MKKYFLTIALAAICLTGFSQEDLTRSRNLSTSQPVDGYLLGTDGRWNSWRAPSTWFADLYTATGTLNTAVTSLETATNTLNTAVVNLNTATGTLNTAVGVLNTATGTLNTAVAALKTSTNALNTAVVNLTTATGTLNTAVGNLNTATGVLNTAIGSLNTATGTLNAAVIALNTATGVLDTAYNNIKACTNGLASVQLSVVTNSSTNYVVTLTPKDYAGNTIGNAAVGGSMVEVQYFVGKTFWALDAANVDAVDTHNVKVLSGDATTTICHALVGAGYQSANPITVTVTTTNVTDYLDFHLIAAGRTTYIRLFAP